MKLVSHAALAAAVLGMGAVAASAQTLEPIRYGTNWFAQAEHGGYYQAVADGTYAACGLDVEIVQGGPQANNRMLLPVGRIDAEDAGWSDEDILRYWRFDETPEAFVEWYAEKYGLIDFS